MTHRRFSAALVVTVGLLMLLPSAGAESPPNATTRTLQPPWNLVAAPESTTIDALVLGKPQIDAVFRWNPDAQQFDSWLRDAPPILNTLNRVTGGEGLWVLVGEPVNWIHPPIGSPLSVPAAPVRVSQWLMMGVTGTDAPVTEAVIGGATRVLGFDAAIQRFRTFDPDLPSALNTLTTLRHGDAVWGLFEADAGSVELTPAFGSRGFEAPIDLGEYPGGLFFVADLNGLVELIDVSGAIRGNLLDLRSQVRSGGEEGLLSVALDPDFESNGYLYAYYTPADGEQTRLSRFSVSKDRANLASELVILEIDQPFGNHNGGAARFGPDAMLYLGLGDGGSGGDPFDNGQNPHTLLGSIIRIDVRNASTAQPYVAPSDNPFISGGGRPEVWAYGLRNPWRMAFDPKGGVLWVGDVGQAAVEEVDIVERGGNYGWNRFEGNDCFDSGQGCDTSGLHPPVATYRHSQGCSVTGGWACRRLRLRRLLQRPGLGNRCRGAGNAGADRARGRKHLVVCAWIGWQYLRRNL